MRGKRNDGKPQVRGLPKRRKNVKTEPLPGSVGELLYKARIARQVSQTDLARKLAKGSGGTAYNGRVSQIELSKTLPTDKELAVFAQTLGLSVTTLRAKRDASERRPWGKKSKDVTRIVNAPKPAARLAAKTSHAIERPRPPPAEQDPAGAPAVADWIEMVDSIVRMPVDPADRKRWFAATMELFALRVKL